MQVAETRGRVGEGRSEDLLLEVFVLSLEFLVEEDPLINSLDVLGDGVKERLKEGLVVLGGLPAEGALVVETGLLQKLGEEIPNGKIC